MDRHYGGWKSCRRGIWDIPFMLLAGHEDEDSSMTGGGGGGASASSTTISGFCEALSFTSLLRCHRYVGCQGTNPGSRLVVPFFGQWTGMCRCGLVLWTAFDATHFLYRTPQRERYVGESHFGSGHVVAVVGRIDQ
jgi:hypothetical protein